MFKKIVAVDYTGIEEFVRSDLENLCETLVMYDDIPKTNEEIIRRSQGADVVLVSWNTQIDQTVIESLPDLKYIGMCCSLFDEASANVDIKTAKKHAIPVVGVKDYGDEGVVEFIYSELIQLIKGLGQCQFREEQVELGGLNLGVIGMGTLGKMVADTGHFFGIDVSYYNRSEKNVDYIRKPLENLLKESDVISFHLPRNAQVFNKDSFAHLGENKILINTGLTLPFDESDFDEWIKENYAILDRVCLSDKQISKYKNFSNIIISNKVTGFTKNARKRLAFKVIDNLKKISNR